MLEFVAGGVVGGFFGFFIGLLSMAMLQAGREQTTTQRPEPQLREPDDLFDQWTCHVCKRWRADQAISVRQHQHVSPLNASMRCNVRYCNDNDECSVGSLLVCWQSGMLLMPDQDRTPDAS